MLIGVSGCGKQSLTKLASFMLNYDVYQIQLWKNYQIKDFWGDIKKQMKTSGLQGKPITFIMTDT